MSSARRTQSTALAGAALGVALIVGAHADQGAADQGGIGRTPQAAEVAALDITVFPDGDGLPAGSGTARQGRAVYNTHCAACHGPRGEGSESYPPLAADHDQTGWMSSYPTVGSYWPYATTLWDYNRRAMPYYEPGRLTTDEVYAVTAFVLYLDDLVDEDEVLDETTLPQVSMPNRDGFVTEPLP